jgi:hypothetical protein
MRMVMSHAGDSALKNTPMMLPAPPRRTAPVAQCSESSHSTPRAPTLHSRCCRGGAVVEVAKGVKWPTGSGRRTPPAQLCSCSAVEAGSKPPAPARPPLNRPGPAATWRPLILRRKIPAEIRSLSVAPPALSVFGRSNGLEVPGAARVACAGTRRRPRRPRHSSSYRGPVGTT